MEIRNQSKTGPTVPPLAEITATLSRQIEDLKQPWLDRLNQDPAGFAHLEREIHDCFRHYLMKPRPLAVRPEELPAIRRASAHRTA